MSTDAVGSERSYSLCSSESSRIASIASIAALLGVKLTALVDRSQSGEAEPSQKDIRKKTYSGKDSSEIADI